MAKRKKITQAAIADETYQQQLQRQISRLRQLPNDFRDIVPGTKAWEDFIEITGRRKEMDTWLHGPVVILETLTRMEKVYFRSQKLIITLDPDPSTFQYWTTIIETAEESKASFIYATTLNRLTVDAWNRILSHFGYNLRIKGQLLDESGVPIGIKH